MAISFVGGRVANGARTWQAAEETAVAGWPSTAPIIVGASAYSNAHAGDTATFELRYAVNGGAINTIGSTGSCKVADVSALTDDAQLATSNFGTGGSSGYAAVACNGGQQDDPVDANPARASTSTTLAKNEYTELQVGLSFADASNADVFTFYLYLSDGTQIGASAATVTVSVVDNNINVNATSAALTLTKQPATRQLHKTVAAAVAALTLTAFPASATVSLPVNVLASTHALTLTAKTATVSLPVNVLASTHALTLTAFPASATVSLPVNVLASTHALTLTAFPASATVSLPVNVLASTHALTLTAKTATVVATTTKTRHAYSPYFGRYLYLPRLSGGKVRGRI